MDYFFISQGRDGHVMSTMIKKCFSFASSTFSFLRLRKSKTRDVGKCKLRLCSCLVLSENICSHEGALGILAGH